MNKRQKILSVTKGRYRCQYFTWRGVKIVQIHNITKKPAKIYVLSLYNFDAM
jgi:hypothetical protein